MSETCTKSPASVGAGNLGERNIGIELGGELDRKMDKRLAKEHGAMANIGKKVGSH